MKPLAWVAVPALIGFAGVAFCAAADVDPIRDKLDKAKASFHSKMEALRQEIVDDLQKSETAARQVPDKKRIDQIKAERKAFETSGQIPASLKPALKARIQGLRSALDKEYLAARDAYLRTRQDAQAELVEVELDAFRKQISAGESVDLLRGIDLNRDTLRGRWRRDGNSLISAAPEYSSVQLLHDLPPQYVLEVAVTKLQPGGDFQMALKSGDHRFTIVLDGWGGQTSGISDIDGRPANQNKTTHRAAVFQVRERILITVTVRKGRISVMAGNQLIIDWTGDETTLSLGQEPAAKDRGYSFLAVQQGGRFRIDAIKLKPLTAEPVPSK